MHLFVSDKCIKQSNKMCCKYVILLIIYIQETITLQRHSCSVWRIKTRRYTSVNGWILENINMLFSFYLACIYGLWREIERGYLKLLGKYTSCFIFTACISIILLVSAHLQWNVLEYYLKWIDHQSQTYKDTSCFFFFSSVLLPSFCTFGRYWLCTCIEIIGCHPAWQLLNMVRAHT